MGTQKSQLENIIVNIVFQGSLTEGQLSLLQGLLQEVCTDWQGRVTSVKRSSDTEGLEKSTTASPTRSMGSSPYKPGKLPKLGY